MACGFGIILTSTVVADYTKPWPIGRRYKHTPQKSMVNESRNLSQKNIEQHSKTSWGAYRLNLSKYYSCPFLSNQLGTPHRKYFKKIVRSYHRGAFSY